MGFLEHLDELRTRLIRSCIAVGAGMLMAFAFSGRIGDFVLGPAKRALPPGADLVTTAPTEGFAFYFDVAFMGGVILSAPFVTYQVWRFIAPGLYAKEKRLVVPLVVMATLGTLAGAFFSHSILFPSSMAMFGQLNPPGTKFMPRVDETFGLYKTMLLAMVAVFQLPTLVFFLARLRLVTAGFLWRNIKYAILIIFIVAALLTSSLDPWNQAAMAAPMLVMYVLSIAIAWLVRPRSDEARTESDGTSGLGLVISAAVFEQARRQRRKRPAHLSIER
jgi:sec-independent protein translocase protein TatC